MESRLVDRVTLGDLAEVYPPGLVDEILAATSAREARVRLLPARLMVYFMLGKALFSPAPYREVLRTLAEPARHDACGWGSWHVPDKAAVFRARQRLGDQPFQRLLARAGPGVATAATPGAFWRGWRLMVIDGTTVEAADTSANAAGLGRPRRRKGHGPAGYPLARVETLIESGTHVVVDAEAGAYRVHERDLAARLARSLRPGMLVLADRGLPGVHLWKQLAATGAELAWRVPKLWKLPAEQALPDGSWISTVHGGRGRTRHPAEDLRVRVVEYVLDDPGRNHGERYRLATTILGPDAAPAAELGALYAERWEAENTLAEWKTYQLGSRNIMTSKSPGLVRQEIYAHLAAHTAVRTLMHQAATCQAEPIDPDRLSFTAALRAVRRSVTATTGIFPPAGTGRRAGQPRPGIARGDQPASPAPRRDPPGQAKDVPLPVLEPRPSPASATDQAAERGSPGYPRRTPPAGDLKSTALGLKRKLTGDPDHGQAACRGLAAAPG